MFEPSDTSRKKCVQCWPLWIAIGFPILLIILQASPIAPNFVFVMLGVPTLLHAWAGAGIWAGGAGTGADAVLRIGTARGRAAGVGADGA